MVIGGDVWWQEGRPEEGGRITVVHRGPGGAADDAAACAVECPHPGARVRRALLPAGPPGRRPPASGSGRVPRGHAIVFANYADQRLYLAGPEVADGEAGRPRPLTPDPAGRARRAPGPTEPSALRYADFVLSPDGSGDLVRPRAA